MNADIVKQRVAKIIGVSNDDERAHVEEDELYRDLIEWYCPADVLTELRKLDSESFSRWAA